MSLDHGGLIVEKWNRKLKTIKGSHMKRNEGKYKYIESGSGGWGCPEIRLLVDVASMILMKSKEEHDHASGPQRPRPLLSISIRILGVLVQIVY